MKKTIISFVFSLGLVLFVTGCSAKISPEKIANADYGPKPSNYEELIKNYFYPRLIDPTAPIYTFSEPTKGYTKKSIMFNTEEVFGWKVCGTLNSKNRMGGYTGSNQFFALIKNDKISTVIWPSSHKDYITTGAIESACSR